MPGWQEHVWWLLWLECWVETASLARRRTLANIRSDEVLDGTCFHAVELRTDPGHAVVISGKDGKVLPSVMCSPTLFSLRTSTCHSSLQHLLWSRGEAVFIEM